MGLVYYSLSWRSALPLSCAPPSASAIEVIHFWPSFSYAQTLIKQRNDEVHLLCSHEELATPVTVLSTVYVICHIINVTLNMWLCPCGACFTSPAICTASHCLYRHRVLQGHVVV